jgi:hypothetical protein
MLFRLRIRRVLLSLTSALLFAAGIDPLYGSGLIRSGATPLHEEPLGDPIQDPAAQKALAQMTGPASCESGMAVATFACRQRPSIAARPR